MKSLMAPIILAVLIGSSPGLVLGAGREDQDMMMFLQNFEGSFVTPKFAQRLGQLVISEKYQGAVITSDPPQVTDKGGVWWVTIKIKQWLIKPSLPSQLAPEQLTVWIRKKDAAILSIR